MNKLSLVMLPLIVICLLFYNALADEDWTCPNCGQVGTGNFCTNCGTKRPVLEWTCPNCGQVQTGNFCTNCGTKRPQ